MKTIRAARTALVFIFTILAFLTPFPKYASGMDPFSTERLAQPLPHATGDSANPCSGVLVGNAAMSLQDVVDLSLCNNPQTRQAWINARVQAGQVGVAKSTYLPSLTVGGSVSQQTVNGASASTSNNNDVSATLNYLVYDFGQRSANLDSSLQTLYALNETKNATLQAVFLSAVTDYYQFFEAQATVDSSREAERSALESHNAAKRKFELGAATLSDELQAKTAWSQAILTRIQAEGTLRNAMGVLANVMGLAPTQNILLAPPSEILPDDRAEQNVGALIEAGIADRPDLQAAKRQTEAARANVEAVKAGGMPTISLSGSLDHATQGTRYPNLGLVTTTTDTQSVALSLTIPLFTGFGTTYRIRTAEEQASLRLAQEEQIKRQVELDVWQAYQNLLTSSQSVKSSADLVASATESEKYIFSRYQKGLQNILDLLTAQSTLESAKQQYIQAVFNWRINKAALAKAMGQLTPESNRPEHGNGKKENIK